MKSVFYQLLKNSFIYWIGVFNAKKGKKMQAKDEI